MLQHASEMLTKALLFQKGQNIFGEKGTAIGIKKALNIAQSKGWVTKSARRSQRPNHGVVGATNVEGEGPTIRVRITRNEDASVIRYVSGDDPEGADPEGRQQDETRLQEGLVSDRPLVNIEPIHIRQYLDWRVQDAVQRLKEKGKPAQGNEGRVRANRDRGGWVE
jgi:hypothetical protein